MTRPWSFGSVLPQSAVQRGPARRGGFTLIEALIATSLTLVLMLGVVKIFGPLGESIADSRSTLEMADGIRTAAVRLQSDLAGATVEPFPPRETDGYLQVIEGPIGLSQGGTAILVSPDTVAVDASNAADTTVGDFDDAIFLTTRSTGQPFDVGGVKANVIEVAWFVSGNKLYRKMYAVNGSLADLTKRESRATYAQSESLRNAGVPAKKDFWKGPFTAGQYDAIEDLMLTNVIGFDVKVWDPAARDYKDLGWNNETFDSSKSLNPLTKQYFSHLGDPQSKLNAAQTGARVYDTWSASYEAASGLTGDGVDNDGNGIIDDWADDGSTGPNLPPYNVPLRGIQVKIRCFEPDSRTIREITIIQDFLPK